MNKIKNTIFSKQGLSGAIFGFLIIAALSFVFGPNIYAQFTRETGDAVGWGYGYGYGYGLDYDDNSNGYRIGGSVTNTDYEYDYGYGNRATVQLTISAPSVTTSKAYDGNTTAAVTAGTLSGVLAGETVTVSAAANYSSASVGTGKTITVVYTLAGANAGNYIKPANYTTTGTITVVSSSGGSGGSITYCSSVVYGDWNACVLGYQYRDVVSQSPSSCSLTTTQQIARSQVCTATTPTTPATPETPVIPATPGTSVAPETPGILDKALSARLSGLILLQVQLHGEAWYVYPANNKKYFLGRPADAFNVMRNLGLGATHEFITSRLNGTFPARVSGKILLDVQTHGEAYYIYPKDLKAYYLGRPADAFSIMRNLGLGITNANIGKITTGEIK
jgi:hypothetical protein